MVVVTRLQDGEGVRLPFVCRWSGVLPESAFVSLTRLQSSGLLQSGLGIDSSIYHNFIGPGNHSVYDTEHYVGYVLGLRTEYIARRRNSLQVNIVYEMRG